MTERTNSHQRQILDLLAVGPKRATEIHAALRTKGSKLTIEGVYACLAALDACERVCIVGMNSAGQRVGSAWALPSTCGSDDIEDEPSAKTIDDLMREFSRPTNRVAHGVNIHRCL